MAITLNTNTFIGTLANLIAYSGVLDTYKIGSALTKPLETFRGIDIANGDSRLIMTATLPSVSDTDFANSSLLTVTKPGVKEQVISVDSYKVIPLSINYYLLPQAFVNPNAMATLTAYLMYTMQVAKTLHMYGQIESLIKTRLSAEVSANNHVVSITGDAVSPSDDVQTKLATATRNATLLYKYLKKELRLYELGKKKGYKDASDTTGQLVVESRQNMCLVIDPRLSASLDVDALATLLRSAKLEEGIDIEFIEMDLTNANEVLLCSKDAFTYGYFYQVATTFFDASNLNTNNWLHFSYYKGNVEYAPVEVIKLTNFVFD